MIKYISFAGGYEKKEREREKGGEEL